MFRQLNGLSQHHQIKGLKATFRQLQNLAGHELSFSTTQSMEEKDLTSSKASLIF